MKKLIPIMLALFLTGCSTVKLTNDGRSVRVVHTTPSQCRYVSQVSGDASGMSFSDSANEEEAINDMKNNAAKAGANVVEISMLNITSTTGEAYRCN